MRVNVRAIRRLGSQVLLATAPPVLTGPAARAWSASSRTGPFGNDPVSDLGSPYDITSVIGAQRSWQAGTELAGPQLDCGWLVWRELVWPDLDGPQVEGRNLGGVPWQ
jgi:hypothetical protein